MMIDLDSLFNRAKDVASAAGKKTGELMEISKLKMQSVQYHADMQKCYEKLGAMVYEMIKASAQDSNAISSCVDEVDYLNVKIEEIQNRINDLRNVVACEKCGALNPADSCYCAKCGEKLPVRIVPVAKEEACPCCDEECSCTEEDCAECTEECACCCGQEEEVSEETKED